MDSVQTEISIDEYSVAASPLEMKFNETALSVGTCFFWELNSKTYLVTNWHNVSGKNPITGEHLSATAAQPNKVLFDIWKDRQLQTRGHAWQPLEDFNGPRWLEHPIHHRAVDVVCLELPSDIAPHVFPINTLSSQPLVTKVSDEVFVLGYPLGIGVERLPIWKKASAASETDFDINNLPLMYIDTASAKGMSGSPVIRRATGGATENGAFSMFAGPASRFIGIYSGRLTTGNSVDAQLGMVWKSRVIEEIINGGMRGQH